MSTTKYKINYHCSEDCKQSGCPSHEAILTYQSTGDGYCFDDGKGHSDSVKFFERAELEQLIKLLKIMSDDRSDSVNIVNLINKAL